MNKKRYYIETTTFFTIIRDRTVKIDYYNYDVLDKTPGIIKFWAHHWDVCRDDSGNPCCMGHLSLKPEYEREAEELCAKLNKEAEGEY